MLVYLIRHAHALEADNDAERPLSGRGREQVRALALFLRRTRVLAAEALWHSPLVRARETADLLAEGLGLTLPRTVWPDLEPDADPMAAARRIQAAGESVAVVGHEPHLSALATFLVTGRTAPAVFLMKKGAVLALDGEGPYWSVRWHLSPDLLA